jgi:hypothetical protein
MRTLTSQHLDVRHVTVDEDPADPGVRGGSGHALESFTRDGLNDDCDGPTLRAIDVVEELLDLDDGVVGSVDNFDVESMALARRASIAALKTLELLILR